MYSSSCASLTSAGASTPSKAFTGSVSPTWARRRRSRPGSGASTALEILSVSTSRMGVPTAMVAPSSTSHAVIVPSRISSPHLGMTMGVMPSAAISACLR
jgi:hypothetical protein